MKFGIRSLLVAAAIIAFSCDDVGATIIAQWNFPTSTGNNLTSPIAANTTTDASSANFGWTPADSHLNASYVAGNGTGGFQLSYPGNNSSYLNGTTITLTITASGANLSGLVLSYDSKFNASGVSVAWSYSISGGGGSGSVGTYSAGNGAWANTGNINLGFNLNSGQTVTFTGTISGATANGGQLGFDNINFVANTVSPVPEATNYSLAVFGLIAIGGGAGRYYRMSRKAEVA